MAPSSCESGRAHNLKFLVCGLLTCLALCPACCCVIGVCCWHWTHSTAPVWWTLESKKHQQQKAKCQSRQSISGCCMTPAFCQEHWEEASTKTVLSIPTNCTCCLCIGLTSFDSSTAQLVMRHKCRSHCGEEADSGGVLIRGRGVWLHPATCINTIKQHQVGKV